MVESAVGPELMGDGERDDPDQVPGARHRQIGEFIRPLHLNILGTQ